VTGKIVEDRGGISSGGRRMFRVEVLFDRTNVMYMEIPEDQLEPA
jgi:hypothetical protein